MLRSIFFPVAFVLLAPLACGKPALTPEEQDRRAREAFVSHPPPPAPPGNGTPSDAPSPHWGENADASGVIQRVVIGGGDTEAVFELRLKLDNPYPIIHGTYGADESDATRVDTVLLRGYGPEIEQRINRHVTVRGVLTAPRGQTTLGAVLASVTLVSG